MIDWNEEGGSDLHDAGRTGRVVDLDSAIMLWDPGITSSLQTVYMLCEDSTASNQRKNQVGMVKNAAARMTLNVQVEWMIRLGSHAAGSDYHFDQQQSRFQLHDGAGECQV